VGVRDFFRRTFGAPEERRTISDLPWSYGGGLGGTTVTQDRALMLAPVFAAVRILAGTVSTLPLKAYRQAGPDRLPARLPELFLRLSQDGELVPWLHRATVSLALRGNAYGLVTARDGMGWPTRIDWLNPADVHCDDSRSTIRPDWYWRGRKIDNPEDLIHIPWFTVPGKVQGLSPIASFALTMNTGLYAQAYGNDWFEGGGFPPGTFRNTEVAVVDQDKADVIKARLVDAIRSRRPVVYGKDWEYNPITVPPNEAQFIETMRLSANQIASIYGLPPEDVGGNRGTSLTYATVELNQLDRSLAIRPWLVILEQKFAAMVPEGQYVRFNADAIIRTDVKTRWEVHQLAVGMGARSLDEVRKLEDLPPLPNKQGEEFNTPAAVAARAPQPSPALAPVNGNTPEKRWVIPA
jgi:HK97 family phage portal protein